MDTMANQFQVVRSNILKVTFEGEQDANTIQFAIDQVKQTITKLRSEQKKVYLLIDLLNLGLTHTSARNVGMNLLRELDYDKTAIFGKDLYTKYLVNFIIQASGKADVIKYCNSEQEALDYLQSTNHD